MNEEVNALLLQVVLGSAWYLRWRVLFLVFSVGKVYVALVSPVSVVGSVYQLGGG